LLSVGVVVAVLILAGVAAMHFAARSAKESIHEALGPEGEAAEIKVGLTSIEILDVRIKAPRGWPSDSTLRARRIVVVPDLRELSANDRDCVKNPENNRTSSAWGQSRSCGPA
jgi:hypothetical protein